MPHTKTQSLVKLQDAFFQKANTEFIADDKILSYELYWRAQKPAIDGSNVDLVALHQFQDDLTMAATNTTCTLTVFSSKGEGAEIRYKKKSDKEFSVLGPSIVNTEVERAGYEFECWRKGKRTGATTQLVDCTGKTQRVTITEQ